MAPRIILVAAVILCRSLLEQRLRVLGGRNYLAGEWDKKKCIMRGTDMKHLQINHLQIY